MCKRIIPVVCLVVVLGVCGTPAQALQITWEPPVPVTSIDVLNHEGILVHAGSWGQTGLTQLSVTAGGETIVFNGTNDPGKLVTIKSGGGLNADLTVNGQNRNDGYFTGDTGNAAFNEVMDSFGYDGANPKVLTLNGLIVGKKYLIQLFVADDRTASGGRTQLWSDSPTRGTGNESATFKHMDNVSIIGRFVADATTIKIYGHGVAQSQTLLNAYQLRRPNDLGIALTPGPRNGTTDIPRDTVLSWAAGKFAATHDVYLGTSLADVNSASQATPLGTLAGPGLTTASFNPGRLAFSTTYYWRVDEVNAAPDLTVRKGDIWTFTTEPVAYPVDGKTITVTASSSADGQPPENTLNGSGLTGDLHGNDLTTMWLTAPGVAGPAWIQYQFPKPVQVHEMWVWNQNGPMEPLLGFSAKDMTIEYSMDGVAFQTLGTQQLARGTGQPDYAHNTVVSFADVAAKYVKLTVKSNWGGLLPQYGLSEVRFFTVPVYVREPNPATGATNVAPDITLSWRAGRDAGKHDVLLGTDPNVLVPTATVQTASYTPTLNLGTTYYWRIDEVNATQTPTTWPGDVWKFSTPAYLVVDDFEAYKDNQDAGLAIFQTWKDGVGSTTNGATVGNDPAPFAERTIIHGGSQSMPLRYDNTGKTYAEATRTFASPQNWTLYGIKSLSLYFLGQTTNTGRLYVKINNTRVDYPGEAADIARVDWQPFVIDLSKVTSGLDSVTSLTIGVDGADAKGTLYVDDIRLNPTAAGLVTPKDPGSTNLIGYWNFDAGVGTVAADISGKGHDGTITNATWDTGKLGGALRFDGKTAYVEIPASVWSTVSTQATVSLWVYLDSTVSQQPFTFAAFRDPAVGNTRVFSAHIVWGTTVYFDSGGDTAGYDRINKAIAKYEYGDTWTNWTFVKNAETGEQKIYRNGLLWLSGTGKTKTMSGVTVFTLGVQPTKTSGFWTGVMDDFRLYDRALSDDEVLWLAGKTAPVSKAP